VTESPGLREDRLRLLKASPLFKDTPEELLGSLVNRFEVVEALPGETIFKKGDPGNCLYIVAEGRVRVHDEERALNDLGPYEMFGEMAALDPELRSASVTALEPTRLLQLTQEGLLDLLAQNDSLMRSLLQSLVRRLRARVRDMAEDYLYMQQFARVTAAAQAVEAGIYQPESLDEVAQREDELGQLARVFQRMVRQVYAREQELRKQVAGLRIEMDEARKARQVAEITESEYFQNLKARARQLRDGRRRAE
jgi:CRP-like cAMP-binding protein